MARWRELNRAIMLVGFLVAGFEISANAQTQVTIGANKQHSIGGVSQLDRAQYFNHSGTLSPPNGTNLGNLANQVWQEDQLNTATGRIATELDQFISVGLPEDASKPGYFDHPALISKLQGSYKNFVTTGSRWNQLRQAPNPILVQSGRAGGFYPDFIDGGGAIPVNNAAYADFLNVYLEEVVYGPNSFLPIDQNRFYMELINEPNVHFSGSYTIQDMIDMHSEIAQLVKAEHPEAKFGGPSYCCADFGDSNFDRWTNEFKPFIDQAGADIDFLSFHPYDRYSVLNNGQHQRDFAKSPSHMAATLDMMEGYMEGQLGEVLPFSFTEYGSWNRTNLPDVNGLPDYGSYTRSEQQWDLVDDIREKLFVFMQRPDRIVNATPFVSPRHWQNTVPTNPAGDNVFWEQVAGGQWQETIVASMFRMYAPVSGQYIDIETDNSDLQTVAFRNGNQLYVLLNNLQNTTQDLDLQAITGIGNVSSASWSRIYRSGSTNTFVQDADITGSWQSLALEPEAGAVLTLTLDGPAVFDQALESNAYYGDQTVMPITPFQFMEVNVATELEDATSAKLRFGYGNTSSLPAFSVRVNGNSFTVPAGLMAIDDGDDTFVSREIDIPLAMLNDGNNLVQFFFTTNGLGGQLSSAVIEVTRSLGDFNTSGGLDSGDLDELYLNFGAVPAGSKLDLAGDDNQVDHADANYWASTLRGAAPGDSDVDGDIDTRDIATAFANLGAGAAGASWITGNTDGDGDVDNTDTANVIADFNGAKGTASNGASFPGAATNPDLVYDPDTGSLSIDADGTNIIAFQFGTDDSFLTAADFSQLDVAVGSTSTIVDNTSNVIGWVSDQATGGVGFDAATIVNLGELLPTGLDGAGLASFLSGVPVWGGIGTGGTFDILLLNASPIGDFNGDGIVDAADYTFWLSSLGQTVPAGSGADASGNGVVDADDYNLWKTNFGISSGGGAILSASIPKPTCLLLSLFAAIATLTCRIDNRSTGN